MLLFRAGSVAFFNGLVTLIILLVAPLGLAAVLTCTMAVTFSSLVVGGIAEGVVRYLGAADGVVLRERGRD